MKSDRKWAAYLLYGAAAVLLVFAAFIAVHVAALGQLPGRMEEVMGRGTGEIAADHPGELRILLAGFRILAALLLAYGVGLLLLARGFGRGNDLAGTVAFTMQVIFLPLATLAALMASPRTPWPVWVLSGLLTLAAFLFARRARSADPRGGHDVAPRG